MSDSGPQRSLPAVSLIGGFDDAPAPAQLGERYRLVSQLGSGGAGEVWLGWDSALSRNVAIKRPHGGPGSPAAQTLLHEAAIAGRLDHPAIAPIHDVIVDDDRLWVVSAWVQGQTLHERLRGDARPAERATLLRELHEVATGIGHAHRNGVVHRDVSPTNIVLDVDGGARVIDWGVALEAGDTPSTLAGTPGYMPPEAGALPPADPRADVWSLGAVLHRVLYGTTPDRAPADHVSVSPDLEAVMQRALAAAPDDRYADAAAFARDLGRWLDGERVEAYAFPLHRLLGRAVQRYRLPLAALGIGLLLALVAGAWGTINVQYEARRARDAEQAAVRQARNAQVAEADALRARDEAVQSLAQALAMRAADQLAAGDAPAARRLAADALELGNAPNAVGVRMQLEAMEQWQEIARDALPPCEQRSVHPERPDWFVCRSGQQATVYGGAAPFTFDATFDRYRWRGDELHAMAPNQRWRTFDIHTGELTFEGDYTYALNVSTWQPYGYEPESGQWFGLEVPSPPDCGSDQPVVERGRDGTIWARCTGDRLFRWRADLERWQRLRDRPYVSAIAVLDDGTAWGATYDGVLVSLDDPGRSIVSRERIETLAPARGDAALWARTARGVHRRFDVASHAWTASLPITGGLVYPVREGEVYLYRDDERVHLRRSAGGWHRVTIDGPVTDVSWSPDGSQLWVIDAGSETYRLRSNPQELLRGPSLSAGVGRGIFERPDGGVVAATALHRGVYFWPPGAFGNSEPRYFARMPGARRIVGLADDTVLFMSYQETWLAELDDGDPDWRSIAPQLGNAPSGYYRDAGASPDRQRWALVSADSLRIGRVREASTELLDIPPGNVVAITDDGDVATADRDGVRVRRPDGALSEFQVESPVTALTFVGPSLLATGHADGRVQVRGLDGTLFAQADLHRGRVSSLEASPDLRRLASGGWDAKLRIVRLEPVFAASGVRRTSH